MSLRSEIIKILLKYIPSATRFLFHYIELRPTQFILHKATWTNKLWYEYSKVEMWTVSSLFPGSRGPTMPRNIIHASFVLSPNSRPVSPNFQFTLPRCINSCIPIKKLVRITTKIVNWSLNHPKRLCWRCFSDLFHHKFNPCHKPLPSTILRHLNRRSLITIPWILSTISVRY